MNQKKKLTCSSGTNLTVTQSTNKIFRISFITELKPYHESSRNNVPFIYASVMLRFQDFNEGLSPSDFSSSLQIYLRI